MKSLRDGVQSQPKEAPVKLYVEDISLVNYATEYDGNANMSAKEQIVQNLTNKYLDRAFEYWSSREYAELYLRYYSVFETYVKVIGADNVSKNLTIGQKRILYKTPILSVFMCGAFNNPSGTVGTQSFNPGQYDIHTHETNILSMLDGNLGGYEYNSQSITTKSATSFFEELQRTFDELSIQHNVFPKHTMPSIDDFTIVPIPICDNIYISHIIYVNNQAFNVVYNLMSLVVINKTEVNKRFHSWYNDYLLEILTINNQEDLKPLLTDKLGFGVYYVGLSRVSELDKLPRKMTINVFFSRYPCF